MADKTVVEGRLNEIADAEPPRPTITFENVFDPPTPYENWLMKLIYTDPRRALQLYMEFLEGLPVFDGPADGADVRPPWVGQVDVPRYWETTPIHFTQHTDPRWLRINWVGGTYYTFTQEERARALFQRLYGGTQPRRILDMGCGLGGSTFALAALFPAAEVVGIDLSQDSIRANRERARRLGVSNISFYYANGQALPFDDASFDIVHEAYVIHEQPRDASSQFLAELKRVLKPGERFSVVDVIYDETEEARQARVARGKGPEPFLAEYMRLNPQEHLRELGLNDVIRIQEPGWDAMVLTGTK